MSQELDMSGNLIATQAGSIGDEIRADGWEKNTVPSGAAPRPASTSGSRGAADIGKL